MNTALWIVAVLLAIAFLMAGMMKITQPREKLAENMAWVNDLKDQQVKTIGALEVLGAIGLVAPAVFSVAPSLVAGAAVGLVAIMIGAVITHIRRREPQMIMINVVLGALALFVAWGRFGDYPFTG